MPLKKVLVQLLDRPGGRLLLGTMLTSHLRRFTDEDIEIRYVNGLWTRRIGSFFFPDERLKYENSDYAVWKSQMATYDADAKDYWLQHYNPRDGDIVVDVGAGRGEDTLTFSRGVGETGRVIAIEAHPVSFAILKSFCQLNQLKNVTPMQIALLDKPGTVQVEEAAVWVENAIGESGSSGTAVRADTFDEVYESEGLGEIAFLKMNIEGAERYALPGMGRAIQGVRQICIACHDFRAEAGHGEQFRTRAFVEQYLSEKGFALFSRPNDPRPYVRDHVFGVRP